MPDFTPILDHEDQGVALLLGQFKDKPRIEELIRSFLSEVQELENQAFAVAAYRLLPYAYSGHLNTLGTIVGEPRNGRTDDEYRRAINVRILVNDSNGQAETLIAVVALYEQIETLGGTVVITEYQPAAMVVELLGKASADPVAVGLLLRQAKAAGVRLSFVYLPSGDTDTSFTLSDASSPTSDPDTGLGDTVSPPTGGALAGVV